MGQGKIDKIMYFKSNVKVKKKSFFLSPKFDSILTNFCFVFKTQESSSPNASTSLTPRTSHRSRTNRYSTELETGIRFEEPPLSSSSSSGHLPQQQQQHRSKQSRSTSNSKSEDKSPNKSEEAR